MGQKQLKYACCVFVLSMWGSSSFAQNDPNLKILSPLDGAVLKQGEPVPVDYEIVPDPGGDHSHIYIDHKEAGILRRKKAIFTLDPLPPGQRSICLKVVNKAHAPIGQVTCINVSVE